jgi:hypothetical protein
MKMKIQDFVEICDTCQRNKGEEIKISRAFPPLSIPTHIWANISMNFIVGLSRVGNKSMIMVVIDHLSKYAPFSVLPHTFTPSLVS